MNQNADHFWKKLEPLYSQAEAFARHMAPTRWQDVLQEALLKALNGFGKLRQEDLFKYWLFRIIANEARRAHRKDFWHRFLPMSETDPDGGQLAMASAKGVDSLDLFHLKAAIAELSFVKRQTLLLYHLAGFSVAEIATMRKESKGAVKSRLSRTRRELRKALEGGLDLSVIRNTKVKELDHDFEQCIQAVRPE